MRRGWAQLPTPTEATEPPTQTRDVVRVTMRQAWWREGFDGAEPAAAELN